MPAGCVHVHVRARVSELSQAARLGYFGLCQLNLHGQIYRTIAKFRKQQKVFAVTSERTRCQCRWLACRTPLLVQESELNRKS